MILLALLFLTEMDYVERAHARQISDAWDGGIIREYAVDAGSPNP